MYWIAGFPVVLVLWASISYAARSTARPQLVAAIDRVHVMNAAQIIRDPEYAHQAGLLLVVSVRNSGTPSIADGWKLSVSIAGSSEKLEAKGIMIPPNSAMQVRDAVTSKSVTYAGVDASTTRPC